MNISEILAFVLYFAIMLGIGFYFMRKMKGGEEEYFLGGRSLGPWVTGLSAQASDMSGWLLMGFPGSILLAGFGKIWIAIGLAIGAYLSWLLVAKRLRCFSEVAGNSITLPQYLNNRFKSSSLAIQIVSAVVFFVCFTVYVASAFKAGATLFSSVLGIENGFWPMVIFAVIVIAYTFTGGFKAVCWTDFFQALLMLGAMMILPIILMATRDMDFSAITSSAPNYYNLLSSGKFDWASISEILTGLGWGLGYFGMPHIIIRYMAINNPKKIKASRRIACGWVVITLALAVVIAIFGRVLMPELVESGNETVFIRLVRATFPAFISGILLSAILAASMSTADSQLLQASSSFTSDIYKPIFRKNAGDKEMLWMGRAVVILISIVAFIIAINPGSGTIMSLVENAWAGFGAAFGPVIILSLFWKRLTYTGTLSGIIAGGVTVILWLAVPALKGTGLYEIIPGFIIGLLAAVIVSLIGKKPSAEVEELFNDARAMAKEK